MTVRNKNDIAVDNAVVDHPDTMCGVLDKSKTEADKVFHTYDEKRIYNLENVPTEKTQFINNRMSMVSGVSQLSKMTGLTGTTGTAGPVNWNNVLNKVPPVEEFAGDLHGRAGSALSNVTDVTINENRIRILQNHQLIANLRQKVDLELIGGRLESEVISGGVWSPGHQFTPQNIYEKNTLNRSRPSQGIPVTNRTGMVVGEDRATWAPTYERSSHLTQESGLHRSPSRASYTGVAQNVQFGTSADLDTLQRAVSPTSSIRHTENSLLANAHHNDIYETDQELTQEVNIFEYSNKSVTPRNGPSHV